MKYVANNGEGVETVTNAYAQFGSFCHELIDKWAKGEAAAKDLLNLYVNGYSDAVTMKFSKLSKNADEVYYSGGYDYFADFNGIVPNATVVESEKKHFINLFGFEFSGILDLVLRLDDGREMLVDHKSSSINEFRGKKLDEKFRQLYLYAEIRKRVSGKYPDILTFNMIRENKLIKRPFDAKEHQETMEWIEDTVLDLAYMLDNFGMMEFEWPTRENYFFCTNICDVSEDCIT